MMVHFLLAHRLLDDALATKQKHCSSLLTTISIHIDDAFATVIHMTVCTTKFGKHLKAMQPSEISYSLAT